MVFIACQRDSKTTAGGTAIKQPSLSTNGCRTVSTADAPSAAPASITVTDGVSLAVSRFTISSTLVLPMISPQDYICRANVLFTSSVATDATVDAFDFFL